MAKGSDIILSPEYGIIHGIASHLSLKPGALTVTGHCIAFLTLAFVGNALSSVIACEIRVRDSAFRIARDVHKLCVIAEASDASADALAERLHGWLEECGATFNLEIVRIDADDPATNWRSIGLPSAPPTLPVTVLVGRNNGIGESFVIDHWEAAPTTEELSALVDSPARQQLAALLARNLAVLIVAPGESAPESSLVNRMKSVVEGGVAGERIGLAMITLDRNDPAEQLLCCFMGLRPNGNDTVCVAFGRGKLMGPPLVGEDITADNINSLVTQICQACSCSQPLQTMGVDVPLVWSDAIDASVILMDQEIALSELDAEVQNMLAAKAASEVVGEPQVIPIPPGRPSTQSLGVAVDTPNRLTPWIVGLAVLCGTVVLLALSRRRSAKFH